MTPPSISRRKLLAAAGVMGAGLTLNSSSQAADPPPVAPRNAAEALKRLAEGNARFVAGKTRHAHESADWRKGLTAGQHPFATLLCCSDSRVPPELVFDQGLGDIFVIRVAGNVIDTDVIGSVQYAARHLATALIVVMGHEGCGAVTAAVEALAGKGSEPKYIEALIKRIEPGLAELPAELKGEARVAAAVEANVRWSVKQIAELPEARQALEKKQITLAGATYELRSGAVRFLK